MSAKIKLPKKLIPELARRWQAGIRYPALAKAAGEALGRDITIGTLRFWMIKHFGGQAMYDRAALKRETAHPLPKLGPPRREVVAIDDSRVPVIVNTPYADGWSTRRIVVGGYYHQVFISPKGVEYVKAAENQKADLVVDHEQSRFRGLGITRLRLYQDSRQHATVKQETKDQKGRAAKKRKKGRKKGRRRV